MYFQVWNTMHYVSAKEHFANELEKSPVPLQKSTVSRLTCDEYAVLMQKYLHVLNFGRMHVCARDKFSVLDQMFVHYDIRNAIHVYTCERYAALDIYKCDMPRPHV